MRTMRRDEEREARARRLYMALRGIGWRLTKPQYMTCRGWIGAGQFEQAERFIRRHSGKE